MLGKLSKPFRPFVRAPHHGQWRETGISKKEESTSDKHTISITREINI